jgi:hypothetical protein
MIWKCHRHGNPNPILDTWLHAVEFVDGAGTECSANVITENMWAQCNIDGNQHQFLEAILDHKMDGRAVRAVQCAEGCTVVNGHKHMKKSTMGWQLCIQCEDGSASWERLANIEDSNPIEVAEHSVALGINGKPAFAWWVDCALKKRNRIISAVKQLVVKKTHKFGMRVPNNVDEAHALDKANSSTLWADAIAKEMKQNVRVAFNILEGDKMTPVGHQEI